jgi:hydrogenase maturation factor
MHDPTEGGLATGLGEIGGAAGLGIEIYAHALPLPTAARLCAQFNLDPLGTIASGALCLVIAPQHQEPLLAAFHQAGIPAAIVGKLLAEGAGEWLLTENGRERLPEFAVDEITKLF